MDRYSVRSAPREQLIAELEKFADDRERVGKHERAAGARQAAAKLAEGADVVFFERCYHEVGDTGRHGVVRRTRADTIAELHDASSGWAHFGKDLLAFEARKAAGAVAHGADRVEVGHHVYEIIDSDGSDTSFSGTREEVLQQIRRHGVACARTHRKQDERELEAAQAAIEAGADRATGAGTTYVVV